LQVCEEKPQFFLALPFIIFDMFLGDIQCLGHAPFNKPSPFNLRTDSFCASRYKSPACSMCEAEANMLELLETASSVFGTTRFEYSMYHS